MTIAPDILELLGPSAPLPLATVDAAPLPVVSAVATGREMAMGGAYEGASRFDQSLALWSPPMQSADADLLSDKPILDARVRDTLRNDAYVAGGAALHKDNIVGSTFLLNAKPETKVLFGRADDVWEQEFQEEVETKFMLWAESPNHWMDAARAKTLTAFVRLAVGVYTSGGEVLASAEWMPRDGRPFRTAVQMIDTDRLSDPWDKQYDDNIRSGVERDENGAPVAYHIRMAHPSDYRNENSYKWKRVLARKPGWGRQMMLHIYEPMRADQTRGISSMVTALAEMKMTKGFRKVELQRAVVAATYAASIESDMPPEAAFAAMGEGDLAGGVTDYAAAWLAAISEYSGGGKGLAIDGVKIPHFFPGTTLKLQNPGNTGPMGDKFEQSLLRHISAALGVSYEQLSRDYTQTNYSSARAAMGETWKAMLSKKKIVADTTASFIYRLWLEEAINLGAIECLKRPGIPKFYEGLNAEAYSACEWIGAGQGQIDPLKEAQADVLQLKAGTTTKERVIAKNFGGDWRRVAKQIGRERALDASLGNPSVYDIEATPMENALSGTPQEREG